MKPRHFRGRLAVDPLPFGGTCLGRPIFRWLDGPWRVDVPAIDLDESQMQHEARYARGE
jgi:hypothetical protein